MPSGRSAPRAAASAPRIVTALDPETQALLARNPWNTEFAGRVAFLDLGGRQTAWTADRTEFLGRNGGPDRPAGLDRGHRLAGRRRRRPGSVRRPPDQLRARRRSADPGRRAARRSRRRRGGRRPHPARPIGRPRGDAARRGELLGRHPGDDPGADARPLDGHHAQPLADLPDARLPAVGAVGLLPGRRRLRVPRPAPGRHRPGDRRSASSPASTSCGPRPISSSRATSSTGGIRRRAAACGPGSRTIASGCRTRSIATSPSPATRRSSTRSSRSSRDRSLQPGPDGRATSSRNGRAESASLFEHCAAALDRSLAVGAHGLPLIGSGDWNDGMNRVGHEGRGESVWLGWFLHIALAAFAPIAEARGEHASGGALASPHGRRSGGRSSATAGTATGTDGRTSTTARRSARR